MYKLRFPQLVPKCSCLWSISQVSREIHKNFLLQTNTKYSCKFLGRTSDFFTLNTCRKHNYYLTKSNKRTFIKKKKERKERRKEEGRKGEWEERVPVLSTNTFNIAEESKNININGKTQRLFTTATVRIKLGETQRHF